MSLLGHLPEGHPDHGNIAALRIHVKHNIHMTPRKYLAIPWKDAPWPKSGYVQAMDEFVGEGGSEEEAIQDCVGRVALVGFAEIFPEDKKTKG